MSLHRLFFTTVCLFSIGFLRAQDYSVDEVLNDRIMSILEPHKVALDSQKIVGYWNKHGNSIEMKPNNKFKVGWSAGCWSPIVSIRNGGKWSIVKDKMLLRAKSDLDSMDIYSVDGSYFLVNSDIHDDSWGEAKILSADILNQQPLSDDELLQIVTSCLLKKSSSLEE